MQLQHLGLRVTGRGGGAHHNAASPESRAERVKVGGSHAAAPQKHRLALRIDSSNELSATLTAVSDAPAVCSSKHERRVRHAGEREAAYCAARVDTRARGG